MDFPNELKDELAHNIRTQLRAGYSSDGVREFCIEAVQLDPAHKELWPAGKDEMVRWIETATDSELAQLEAEKHTWPDVTDYDRLMDAAQRLGAANVLFGENVGWDSSDVIAEMWQWVDNERSAGRAIEGYVAFHGQDLERAVNDGLLYLFFAGVGEDQPAVDIKVAKIALDALKAAGLSPAWSGKLTDRLEVPIVWLKR